MLGGSSWVTPYFDALRDKLFAHDLASGERLPDSDLALHPDNNDPRGIWSDGSTMWVLDDRDDALFGYDLATGELVARYALDSDNNDPRGIWSEALPYGSPTTTPSASSPTASRTASSCATATGSSGI